MRVCFRHLPVSVPLLVFAPCFMGLCCASFQHCCLISRYIQQKFKLQDFLPCFCQNFYFSLRLLLPSAPWAEKCRCTLISWFSIYDDVFLGCCLCFEVSLCNSHKLFLSNLVLAWMKPAWKWEQDWNCSNLGKRRRALLVSTLIFLCSLRETQFKLLHSSFVPSSTGFRWSGGALIF